MSGALTINRRNEVYDGDTKLGDVVKVRVERASGLVRSVNDKGEPCFRVVKSARSGWVACRADGAHVQDAGGIVVKDTRGRWADRKAWSSATAAP